MEGLKLIAQSTFDRHQKFRPAGDGQSPYRYNVVEIGAFIGVPAPQFSSLVSPTSTTASHQTSGSRTVSKRQSVGSLQQQQQQKSPSPGSGAGATHLDGAVTASSATTKRVTLNEWMVHEDDLVAFMKKRPVELVATSSSTTDDRAAKSQQSVTTNSTGAHSKAFTSPSGSKPTENTSAATGPSAGGAAPTAASNDNRNATSTKRDRGTKPDEIEAVASLKLICIPRVDPPDPPDLSNSAASGISGDDFPSEGGGATALAISREAFLRLYVDQMDADHCALYYLARDYDGFHEFNDHSRGIVTKFVGTSDYALIWTFNRRTLETKGLFIDRYHRWQPTESSSPPTTTTNNYNATRAPTSGFGSAPVTPSNKSIRQESSSVTTTPSKRWTKRQTGTVSSSLAWAGFRDTLKMYRKYIYAPQLPSFVCCVHMLRSFDDEVNDEDLPALRNIEANLGAFQQQQQQQQPQQYHHRDGSQGSDAGGDVTHNRLGGFVRAPSSSFAFISQQQQPDPFASGPPPPPPAPPTTTPPPPQQEDYYYPNNADMKNSLPNLMTPSKLSLPVPPLLLDTEKLALQARATNRVDTSLANKLRHLKVARTILELLARDHETVIVDVVAPAFLDRYHWTMEGMTEAIPALERHIGSLEEYLGYLKGRAERLTGLVRSITAFAKYHDATAFAFAFVASSISASASAPSASVSSRCCANYHHHHHHHHHNNASASSLSLSSSNFQNKSDDFAQTKNGSQFQSSDASLSLRCNDGADSRSGLLGSLLDPPNGHHRRQPRPRPRPVAAQSSSSSRSSRSVLVPSGLGPGDALGIVHPRPNKPSSHHHHQSSPPPPPDDVDKTPTATATALSPSTTPPPLPTTSSHNLRAAFYNPTTSRRLRRPSSSTTTTVSSSATHSHNSTLTRTTEQSRSSNRGFYASYLLRGNYSHRLA